MTTKNRSSETPLVDVIEGCFAGTVGVHGIDTVHRACKDGTTEIGSAVARKMAFAQGMDLGYTCPGPGATSLICCSHTPSNDTPQHLFRIPLEQAAAASDVAHRAMTLTPMPTQNERRIRFIMITSGKVGL